MLFDEIIHAVETETTIEQKVFEHEKTTGTNADKIMLEHVQFIKCQITDCDFENGEFINALFDGCDLSNCRLKNAYFKNSRFLNCKMDGCSFASASLYAYLFTRKNFRFAPCVRFETTFYNDDCLMMVYVLSGHGNLTVDTETISLGGRCLCIIAPNIDYRFYGAEDCVALYIMVWKKCFSEIFTKIFRHKNVLTEYYAQILNGQTIKLLEFYFSDTTQTYPLIRNSELSIEEIAFRVGYASLVSFSRRFSKDVSYSSWPSNEILGTS